MRRLALLVAVLLACPACGERPSTTVLPAPAVEPESAVTPVTSVSDPAPPAWAAGDAERDGWYEASGSSAGPQASPEAAVLAARAELGRIRAVRIKSLIESVTVEVSRNTAGAVASRFGDAVQSYSDSVIAGSETVRREAQQLADGRVRWWAQVRIPVKRLLPERRLMAIMEGSTGSARRAALGEEALCCLAGDGYRRILAVTAARLAVSDGGGAPEMITLADCLRQTGQDEEAVSLMDQVVALMDGQPEAVFARYDAVYIQLMATAQSAQRIAGHLVVLGQALAKGRPIRPAVRPIPGGYEATFTIEHGPLRLIGLWVDHEDVGPIAMPGAERPVSGAYTARFTWAGLTAAPRGRIIVLALPPNHPAIMAAPGLATLSLARQNDPGAIARWKDFFASLALQPYEEGFELVLAPADGQR